MRTFGLWQTDCAAVLLATGLVALVLAILPELLLLGSAPDRERRPSLMPVLVIGGVAWPAGFLVLALLLQLPARLGHAWIAQHALANAAIFFCAALLVATGLHWFLRPNVTERTREDERARFSWACALSAGIACLLMGWNI